MPPKELSKWKFGALKYIVVLVILFPVTLFLMHAIAAGGSNQTSTDSQAATSKLNAAGEINTIMSLRKQSKEQTVGRIGGESQPKSSENEVKRKKIAYAITVTKDGHFVDGALVLGYSAKKVHDANKGFASKYDADLIAFVVPSVVTSRPILEEYGWKVLERSLPVPLEEIENRQYAEAMRSSGCCGADEFLKLWAYTLTDYHRVVHLDMDSIIFNNMDELYEMDKEMLFTGDWNMRGGSPVPPAQGGFLVVRPSMKSFEEFRDIIRKGDHQPGGGWGGSRIGNFWGGQTIQGIVPYFYHSIHPGQSLELDRCVYNCMVDNPYIPHREGVCLDGQPTCKDCRKQKPELVKSAHFTICQKPWTCTEHVNPRNKDLCMALHEKWFALRNEFELSINVDPSYRAQRSRHKDSMGMCKGYGDSKYIPIPLPDHLSRDVDKAAAALSEKASNGIEGNGNGAK